MMKVPALLFLWIVSNGLVVGSTIAGGRSERVSTQGNLMEVKPCVEYHIEKNREAQWYKDLEAEKTKCQDFQQAWTKATKWWEGLPAMQKTSLTKEYAIALYTYTLNQPPFYRKFNKDLNLYLTDKQSYQANFRYKSLHYYLSAGLEEMRKNAGVKVTTVYRGSRNHDSTRPREIGQFMSFTSTSTNRKVAERFTEDKEGHTVYHILTSQGALIQGYSCFVGEQEWLIPPCQPFLVVNVSKSSIHGSSGSVFFLNSSNFPSPALVLSNVLLLAQYKIFW